MPLENTCQTLHDSILDIFEMNSVEAWVNHADYRSAVQQDSENSFYGSNEPEEQSPTVKG